jgi:hypothetical protein
MVIGGIGALAGWSGVMAQGIETIELRNRPAEELIPLLRPLLSADAALSGTGFLLIVRAGQADLARVKQVVASLDRAARQLLITVRQDAGASGRSAGVDARVGVGGSGAGASASAWDRTSTSRDDTGHSVRVQEGGSAWIATGDSTLLPQRTVTRTVGGTVVRETVVERNLASGFSVTPRLAGDRVTLEISTRRDTPVGNAGAAAVSRVATTVTGRLGEWLELGGAGQSLAAEGSGLLSRSSDAATVERRVFVKVEEVR